MFRAAGGTLAFLGCGRVMMPVAARRDKKHRKVWCKCLNSLQVSGVSHARLPESYLAPNPLFYTFLFLLQMLVVIHVKPHGKEERL
jgi:hypothetical protein